MTTTGLYGQCQMEPARSKIFGLGLKSDQLKILKIESKLVQSDGLLCPISYCTRNRNQNSRTSPMMLQAKWCKIYVSLFNVGPRRRDHRQYHYCCVNIDKIFKKLLRSYQLITMNDAPRETFVDPSPKDVRRVKGILLYFVYCFIHLGAS